jgi:branched-chain amino acid transport system permease protein
VFASLVNGLIVGAGYALVALGIVLIYKATRQFNFAQGEFGTMSTFVAWMLLERGIPWPIAGLVAILSGVALGLVVERVVVRPLQNSPKVTVLVATLGVALFLIAMQIIIGEAKLRALKPMVGGQGFTLAGVSIRPQDLMIVAALLVTGGVLVLFFRSSIGTALLATSQEPFAARLAGISTTQMAMLTWGLAGLFGALAGIVFAPLDAFTPGFMTTRRLIPGFTAAVLGGITSLPGAVVGGFSIGLIESFFGYFLGEQVRGADGLGVFVALLAVLIVRPKGLLGKEA